MTENRLVEGGTFGPVFSWGIKDIDGGAVMLNEGIVEVLLRRGDKFLMIELTVEAAATLASELLSALNKESHRT